MLAPKRALALAAEGGKIKFWKTSARAGCMLYLYGTSGTTYYYIHLNNDLTKRNDNRGKCVAGTAYAKGLKNGAKVTAGQVVGYVGDSGDANGLHPHLHFELHPNRGSAVDPYPWLQRAQHLLFAAPRGSPFMLKLRGKVTVVSEDAIRLKTSSVSAWPMAQHQSKLSRSLLVLVPDTAIVQTVKKFGAPGAAVDIAHRAPGPVGRALDVGRADDAQGRARRRPRAERVARLARRARKASLATPTIGGRAGFAGAAVSAAAEDRLALLGEGGQALPCVLGAEQAAELVRLALEVLDVVALEAWFSARFAAASASGALRREQPRHLERLVEHRVVDTR